jgi:dienelactone hydrolase
LAATFATSHAHYSNASAITQISHGKGEGEHRMSLQRTLTQWRSVILGVCSLVGTACGDPSEPDGAEPLGASAAPLAAGECCVDSDCLCHDDVVNEASASRNGAFRTSSFRISGVSDYGGGTVFFPTNAQPPFAAFVMCPGFTARQSSIREWGPFFASHGIVLMTIDTLSTRDPVNRRDDQLLAALEDLRAENSRRGSPLEGDLDLDRLGVSGWSMGGGGAWLAGKATPALKSVITLAGHHTTAGGARAVAQGLSVPTLMLAGSADPSTLGGGGQSQAVFNIIANDTPKMLYEVQGEGHFSWGTPRTNSGAVGRYALSWQKVFLEGDERFLPFLLRPGPRASDFRSNLSAQ